MYMFICLYGMCGNIKYMYTGAETENIQRRAPVVADHKFLQTRHADFNYLINIINILS